MDKDEVDYWLCELEADYRAAQMSGQYRNKQIHEAILQIMKDRTRQTVQSLQSFYLKIYFMLMVIVIMTRLFR